MLEKELRDQETKVNIMTSDFILKNINIYCIIVVMLSNHIFHSSTQCFPTLLTLHLDYLCGI